jgi:division protein CdvB (Snf7/Vps24/ESCRT-III family)
MSIPAGIFDSFARLIRITSRDSHKNALIYLISSINELRTRLEEIKRRLKERDEELLANAVKALSYSDRDRASIYAAEIAEVRKLMKVVNVALLATERLLERLKTMDIVSDMRKPLSLAIGILTELRQRFSNTMPELALAVETIVSNVNTLVSSTQAPETSVNIAVNSKEIEEIIKEAEVKAEENMKLSLQPIPTQLRSIIETINQNVARYIDQEDKFISSRSTVSLSTPTSYMKLSNLDIAIYQYIIKNNGVLDINECMKKFGVTREDIMNSLKRLEQAGLIRIT